MGNCLITNGIPYGCRGVGGIQATGIFIGEWQDPNSTSSMIIGLSASGAIESFTGSTVSFYEFNQDTEVASLSVKPTVSIPNGTAYNEITLSFTIFEYTQNLINVVNALMQGRWSIIVRGNNNIWYYLGYENPGTVTDGDAGVHQALGDLDGAMLTMTFKEYLGPLTIENNAQNEIVVYN